MYEYKSYNCSVDCSRRGLYALCNTKRLMNNHTPDIEELAKKFNHDMAFQLTPSNDTMKAVRLAHKMVIELLQSQASQYEREKMEAVKETYDHFLWCRQCADGPICSEAKTIAQKHGVDLSE